jgi:hypothetical protein
MVEVPIRMGRTDVTFTARGRPVTIPPILVDVPGGLYPLYSATFEVDEYRIMSGWPVPVPDGDIRVDCIVSAEGVVLPDRISPTSLVTNATMRWVADTNYYDVTSLRWAPIQGGGSPWETSPEHAPTLITDYEYRVGSERFTNMTALNFDSNTADYMWIDLSLTMGGTSGYTVIMVMCPNSIYGNEAGVGSNALWGPATTDGYWVMFTVKDKAVYLSTESVSEQLGVSIGDALINTSPSYLALVVNKQQTTLYASSGASQMYGKPLTTGETAEPLNTAFWLGNGPSSDVATMDMALLDLGIYGTLLTKTEVAAEFASFSKVYGV